MNTDVQISPSLFRSASCYRLRLPSVHFEFERQPQKVGSCQFRRYRFQHRTSSDIDGGAQVSVHELHACSASGWTHPWTDS